MKIALFTDAFLPQVNGVVTATVSLAKGLADRGHRVYIIAPKFGSAKEFRYSGVEVLRVPSVPALFYPDFKFTPFLSPSIVLFLKREKIDLVHFQTPITIGLQGILAAKILNLPLVGTFHTFFTDREYLQHAGMDFKIIENLAWNYAKTYYNQCDLITCPSESAKRELMRNKVKAKIKVISNGVDGSIFENGKWRQVKNRYNPGGKILLFVGRMAHEKNLPYLLKCFKLVLRELPDTKLLLVGGGPQANEIRQRINELGLSKSAIMVGNIPHKKLVKSSIFGACDAFITASKTETQGITMLEAQANGLPCIAIDAKGIRDLIKNGKNGFLAKDGNRKDFSDKVVKVLSDENLWSRMNANTLMEIRKHYLPNVISEWEREYEGLIKHE